ncbi:MAG: DNA-binding transcriptional repressor AcrR [Methanobacterium sp. PtaB.Bin024]|nr:MAG: DNA-binding transcriptional repressor AcrR [Methanobacterium sp. PtaB.Bin024]
MSTKDRIMKTTFKLFLKKGIVDVSLSDIIKAADITTGGFYYHFDSKDTLLVAVLKKYVFDYFNSTIEYARNSEGTPREKIESAMLTMWGECVPIAEATTSGESSEKADYRKIHLLLMEGIQKYDVIMEYYTKYHHNLLNFIKETIDEGVARGIIRSDIDSAELAAIIHSSMVGSVIMWVAMPEIPLEKRIISNMDYYWECTAK